MTWAPFFIVGAARSGTTMLRRLLNRHPQLRVPEETHFIPEKYDLFLKHIKHGERQSAIDVLNDVPLVKKWNVGLSVDDIGNSQGDAAYAQAIDCIMQRRAEQDDKPYWGEKTPSYLFAIPLLRRLFPKAHFIHLYRDGRDVALSIMPLSWGPNNVYACAHWWQENIHAWQRSVDKLGSHAMEIQYEAFTQEPEDHLRRLCKFIGVSYESEMLAGFYVRRGNSGKWRNKFHMSRHELAGFEYVAGETLAGLGYERWFTDPHWSLWLRAFAHVDNAYKTISNLVLRRGVQQI